MERAVVFAGFGGQGLLFAGQILARAAIADGLETFWIPSYGPEMRSGSANCHVCLSKQRIGSPLVTSPQVLIAMSEIALRCGVVQRDRRGNLSGETSWLARRIGVMPEGGRAEITPWVHSDVLGTIAREGLGISPREVELQ